ASNSTADAFTWFNPDGSFLGSGPTQDVDAGGCYMVEVFNTVAGTTCSDLLEVCVIEESALPAEAIISGLSLVCDGDEVAYMVPEDPEAVNYNWSIPEGASIIDGGQDTTYAVVDWSGAVSGQICVTATNFCGDGPEHCFDVVVERVPVRPELSAPESVCPDELFVVQAALDSTALSYSWTVPTDAMIVSMEDTIAIEVQWGEVESGEICLTTTNDCGDSETTCITLIKECNQREIPNIFTPNGDDVNDYFKVLKGSGVTVIGFQVYSRWGQLVYDNQNGDAGWDGRYNGEPMPTDVYAYIITMTLSDGEVVVAKGEVSLVR
ncbi:MAG: gliding motility-associated C-terminal domain-containing protein, partial [Phaeodactylibacter sp.]|nr:gliding motility-associated C-terminal domain-containing protein [Phaeodactylibacter sp.]